MNDLDVIEAASEIAFKALDKAEAWYCEILEQRYAGKDASEAAYEKLKQSVPASQAPAEPAHPGRASVPPPEPAPSSGGGLFGGLGDLLGGTRGPRGGVGREGVAEALAKSAARAIGSQVGREIIRGVLGSILGGARRR